MHSSIRLLSAVTALSFVAVAGCSDATGTGATRSLSLSFSTLPPAGPAASLASLSLSASSASLVLTKAQLVISKSEIARSGATCTSSSSSSDEQD